MQILASGANVILTTKGIDDMSLKYFVEAGAIAVRRVPKDDLRWATASASRQAESIEGTSTPATTAWLVPDRLRCVPDPRCISAIRRHILCCCRRIAKATGGQVVMALADMDGNETFDASSLGAAEEVGQTAH